MIPEVGVASMMLRSCGQSCQDRVDCRNALSSSWGLKVRFAAPIALLAFFPLDYGCGSSNPPELSSTPPQLSLLTAGIASAAGTVTTSPAGTSCGANCVSFAPGANITVTATPTGSALFAAWEGDCAGQGAACSLTMSTNRSTTAHFRPNMNIMFVTSGTITPGTIGSNLIAADTFCSNSAKAAFLGGSSWRAWLATTATSAADHIGASASGWILVDGRPFASSMAELTQGKVFYPPHVTELGSYRSEFYAVASGSRFDGKVFPGTNCADWTSVSDSISVGDATATTGFWAFVGVVSGPSCGRPYPVYCFQIDGGMAAVPPPVIPSGGRHAFLSQSRWTPGGGPAAADAICQADASTAGLSNPTNYQALITTDTAGVDRFDLTRGPWFRLDGAQVVATAADLGAVAGDKMLTTINLDSGGNYIANFNAWTGSGVSPGVTTATANCTHWTMAGADAAGWAGLVNNTRLYVSQSLFWANNMQSCSTPAPVYCLEK
jgi:hypothetical protein